MLAKRRRIIGIDIEMSKVKTDNWLRLNIIQAYQTRDAKSTETLQPSASTTTDIQYPHTRAHLNMTAEQFKKMGMQPTHCALGQHEQACDCMIRSLIVVWCLERLCA
ncbi:hypothetical protein GEOBC_00613 [Geobacteraceae bacterium]|nr:hypothetical protein GEOBC_00613 [Geobacteraceae bacterium]